MFLGWVFHWFICQPHPTLRARWSSTWRTDTGSSYNLVIENHINVISAAVAMFSGTRNPLPWVSTLYDFGKYHNAQTGNSNNSETETDIDAISRANAIFGHSKLGCARIDCVRLQKTASRANFRFKGTVSTSGLCLMLFSEVGYCRRVL